MLFDFRLQVFQAVATRLNFTRAASELFISQPAVTKHIHELESQLKIKLFERDGSKITLTQAGQLLLVHTKQILEAYRNLEFDINALAGRHSGILRLGASTTLAQYVLPPILAAFHNKLPDVQVTLTVNNTEQIEQLLQNKIIDLGVIEGYSKNTAIRYSEFLKDEIVLVSSLKNTFVKSGSILPQQLKEIPLLLREPGSGTLEVIGHALKAAGMSLSDLKSEMQLGGSESIKLYMLHSDCMALLSIHAVLKELQNKECYIVDIEGLNIERYFYFTQLHGQQEALPELFMKFACRNAGLPR
ncbi:MULTISPECIES: LysR substrate-binding domain-containing protein [Dyadobacter]|uniref:LysR family transcriptional regulator n=3 Tax=Dyadobacter TaxID=120831 RepID=A0A5R9K6B9_9BACT|nr:MULTISPECIES: LysR substrate-binding domain-containing protein [Dyadobacter]TDE09848.1 LysR family transcriptional regulator [Dyadobacter psychrotolerans]TLU89327.1 LysR family transcriptional regulator [Dyadobacter sediminis]